MNQIMDPTAVAGARRFVEQAEIPLPRSRADVAKRDTVTANFDTAKNQAAVVGSDVISFVSGVTAERRNAIANSSLLAQLVAKQKVSDPSRIYDWYDAYFGVLTNVGWIMQERSFAEYREHADNLDAHQAILAVATTLLGAAPTALALVTTAINSLHSMDESTSWITIFNRESKTARTARFQISLVEQEAAGQFLVSLMAFGLEAKSTITRVLFFKARADQARLRHYSGRVTINTSVLDGIGDTLERKLVSQVTDYVRTLPDLM